MPTILGLPEPKKSLISWYFYTYEHFKFRAHLSWVWKKFYNLGAKNPDLGLNWTYNPLIMSPNITQLGEKILSLTKIKPAISGS